MRIIATALVVAAACMPTPTASPPTATAAPTTAPSLTPTSAPAATPTARPSAPVSDRYGLIVDTTPPRVRSEADAGYLGALSGEDWRAAVSPDGRQIAWWEAYRSGVARILWVSDASGGAARKLLTLPDSEVAAISTFGGVTWSTDGTGLLIAVNSRDYVPSAVPDAAHLYVTLRQVDVAAGSVREVFRVAPGHPFFPLAWDRGRGVSIASRWGPGGFTFGYTTVRDDGSTGGVAFPTSTMPSLIRTSPTAERVLMRTLFDEARTVHVWRVADARYVPLEAATGERVVGALWRTDTEIVVSLSTSGHREEGDRLEVWSVDGQRRVVLSARHRLDAVRPDGSAAITSAGIVDLATGAVAQMPDMGSGLRVVASVLLR